MAASQQAKLIEHFTSLGEALICRIQSLFIVLLQANRYFMLRKSAKSRG